MQPPGHRARFLLALKHHKVSQQTMTLQWSLWLAGGLIKSISSACFIIMFITFEDFLNVEIYLLLPFFGKNLWSCIPCWSCVGSGFKEEWLGRIPRYRVLWQCDVAQGQPRPPSLAALPTFSSLALCYLLFLCSVRARVGRPPAVFLSRHRWTIWPIPMILLPQPPQHSLPAGDGISVYLVRVPTEQNW